MGVGPVIRAVFLDRDGVLNQAVVREGKPYPPSDASAMRLTDGAGAALARLKALGYLLIVVTNQPDLARGTQLAANMEGIHESLRQQLPLDAFFVCPHDGPDHCACRGVVISDRRPVARYRRRPRRRRTFDLDRLRVRRARPFGGSGRDGKEFA